ncbi:MAG: efflux RND transporter periplasmic adaptor subunit [Bryobacteraceae bacterium]
MLRKFLLLLVPAAILLIWLTVRGTPPPEVSWTRPTRETIVSSLTTNGRVEPVEWAAINSEVTGPVLQIHVQRGQDVHRGQILATVGSSEAQVEVTSAQSRVNAARAELQTVETGGRAPEQAEIESGLLRARADLVTAQTERATLERLLAKKAATAADLNQAKDAIRKAELQIESLERRRTSLVTQPDRQAAAAKLQEAQAGLSSATRRIAESQVRSPIDGILYELTVKPGTWVQPGTPIGRAGKLSQLRVTVYVDEPELGRVAQGMPVSISWDALPGREWKGQVDGLPLQVVPVGTRQVGEVICLIANPDLSLIPGTNVNAEIRSKTVTNALTIPREVLRREGADTGVFKLQDNRVVFQKVTSGVASVTRVQITEGLADSDRVVLPVDVTLKSGDKVRGKT